MTLNRKVLHGVTVSGCCSACPLDVMHSSLNRNAKPPINQTGGSMLILKRLVGYGPPSGGSGPAGPYAGTMSVTSVIDDPLPIAGEAALRA